MASLIQLALVIYHVLISVKGVMFYNTPIYTVQYRPNDGTPDADIPIFGSVPRRRFEDVRHFVTFGAPSLHPYNGNEVVSFGDGFVEIRVASLDQPQKLAIFEALQSHFQIRRKTEIVKTILQKFTCNLRAGNITLIGVSRGLTQPPLRVVFPTTKSENEELKARQPAKNWSTIECTLSANAYVTNDERVLVLSIHTQDWEFSTANVAPLALTPSPMPNRFFNCTERSDPNNCNKYRIICNDVVMLEKNCSRENGFHNQKKGCVPMICVEQCKREGRVSPFEVEYREEWETFFAGYCPYILS